MAEKEKLTVELCMGSSCFARGNSTALGYLESFIEENGLSDRIELGGHLCIGVIDIIRKTLEGEDA